MNNIFIYCYPFLDPRFLGVAKNIERKGQVYWMQQLVTYEVA